MQKQNTLASAVYILMITLIPALLSSQVVVGGDIPDPSAALDIRSTEKGVLLPRLTTAERDAVSSPATGLTIFNTSSNCLEANLGTPAVPDWVGIKCRTGVISALDCSNAVPTGALTPGQAASGVSVSVSYTGGNGGVHNGQTINSTGVTGLTATLSAGSFVSGSGNLSYSITGTPAGIGNASFALNIGGQTCTLNINVSYVCRAKVNATDYKNFMCYNLGSANTSADPFTPSWEINGGYWQWGRLAQAAAGPTGPGAGAANSGAVSGWNTTDAPDGSWADGSKTASDPCPTGYRVPTKAQWDGVLANNTKTSTGSFSISATNYSAGVKFGDHLMLPPAGVRSVQDNGVLYLRGYNGNYWSSTAEDTESAWTLNFEDNSDYTGTNIRPNGLSVRCISE